MHKSIERFKYYYFILLIMFAKRIWPKIDTCGETQEFVNQMCIEYDVPFIKVIVKSKKWIEWFAGKGVVACAFRYGEGSELEKYMAFDGQRCRISGSERNIPIKIKHRWQVVERVHTVIHEFIHHYFWLHHDMDTANHGREFRKMETQMNAEYGIYFVYSRSNYGTFFHTFWGIPYGNKMPSSKERGWI